MRLLQTSWYNRIDFTKECFIWQKDCYGMDSVTVFCYGDRGSADKIYKACFIFAIATKNVI